MAIFWPGGGARGPLHLENRQREIKEGNYTEEREKQKSRNEMKERFSYARMCVDLGRASLATISADF